MYVFERLPFSYSSQKLQGFLTDTVMSVGDPICPIAPGFGGWSITSRNGSWQDGWRKTNEVVSAPSEYTKPTELFKGYVKDIVDDISSKGLTPTKIRINNLPPGGKSTIHRDYPAGEFRARLHIPILTNPQCCHILYSNTDQEITRIHMESGNVYMFWVNLKHQYINESKENRYHIVMDVLDTKGITENFKCIMQ